MDGIHGKSCVSCSLQLMLPGTNDVPRGMESEEYWSGCHFLLGNLPDPGIELTAFVSPALAGRFFTTVPLGSPVYSRHLIHVCRLELVCSRMH